MSISEIIAYLVKDGCNNLSSKINWDTFSKNPICQGGFGDIYRGNLLDGTCVAVKTARFVTDRDPKHLKHAAQELHAWSKLKHRNIIPLLGLVVFRDRIGMVSPWMRHGNLPQYLERTQEANRAGMCVQICEGLAYLLKGYRTYVYTANNIMEWY
ncbi:kinase-like domain-containing protein [Rhizoctonia solani]|nr:kinase-like domain-containing protein [Rhizoctonia solani]